MSMSWASLVSAIAAAALAFTPFVAPLGVVGAALSFLALAARFARRGGGRKLAFATSAVLGGGAALGLGAHLFFLPSAAALPAQLVGFRGLTTVALAFLAAYLCAHLRASLVRARFFLALACFAAMGAAVLPLSPGPAAPRLGKLAALILAAGLLGRPGGTTTSELAALFSLFQPSTFFVLEGGSWAPIVPPLAALALLVTQRRWPLAGASLCAAAAAACATWAIIERDADFGWLAASLLSASAAAQTNEGFRALRVEDIGSPPREPAHFSTSAQTRVSPSSRKR